MKFDFSAYIVSVIMLLFNTVYSQDSFEEFQNQQQQAQEHFFEDEISEFQNYVASVTAQYDAYEQQQDREFEEFKEAVEEKWQDFKSPSKKEYVEYDDDLDSRATVDFEKGEITVEVIVEEEVTEPSLEPSEKVEQTAPKKKLIPQEIKNKKMDKEPESFKSIVKKVIGEKTYDAMLADFPIIDYSKLSKYETEDNTTGAQTVACSGDSCEII